MTRKNPHDTDDEFDGYIDPNASPQEQHKQFTQELTWRKQRDQAREERQHKFNRFALVFGIIFFVLGGFTLFVYINVLHEPLMDLMQGHSNDEPLVITQAPEALLTSLSELHLSEPQLDASFQVASKEEMNAEQRLYKTSRLNHLNIWEEMDVPIDDLDGDEARDALMEDPILKARHIALFTRLKILPSEHDWLHRHIINQFLIWRTPPRENYMKLLKRMYMEDGFVFTFKETRLTEIALELFYKERILMERTRDGFEQSDFERLAFEIAPIHPQLADELNKLYAMKTMNAIFNARMELYAALGKPSQSQYYSDSLNQNRQIVDQRDFYTLYLSIEKVAELYRKRFPLIGEMMLHRAAAD